MILLGLCYDLVAVSVGCFRSAAVRVNDTWILIGTAALRIVVGVFLIRTAVKIVTCCDVFFAAVQFSRILIAIKLQFGHIVVFLRPELCHPLSLVHSFLPVSIFAVFSPPRE